MRVAFIVPFYKVKKEYMKQSITSIINQTYKDLEIIDKLTPEQLAAFKEKSKPIYDNGAKEFGKDLIEAFGYKY